MSKKQKGITDRSDEMSANSDDEKITDLIQQRKLQQEALKKIMTSIDSKADTTEPGLNNIQKKRTRIRKLFSSSKNPDKK